MITMKKYYDALLTIREGCRQKVEENERISEELRAVQTKYRDLIYKLEKRQRKEESKWIKERETVIPAIDHQMEESVAIRKEFKTMMELFKVIQNDSEGKIKEPTVYSIGYGDKVTYKHMGLVYTDPCSSIYAYIVANRKPKNKLSFILVGNTIFHEKALYSISNTLPRELHDYGVDAGHENANIIIRLKDAPTEKELIDYFNKNKDKLINDFKNKFKPVIEKYQQAKILYQKKEWQIGYLEHQKDYYENHYCKGTETPEYKEVIKKLETLTKK